MPTGDVGVSGTRAALLIGCSAYEDPKFPQLPTSVQDVDALTRVLGDQTIGDFTVDTRFNEPPGEVSEQIEKFFADRKPDDLLLLYFSCHGVLDPRGRLYFVLAKNPHALLPLPADLEQVLASEIVWKRLWAVDGLRHLLAGDHPGGQKRRARQALDRLRDDDTDFDVRAAVGEALRRVSRRPHVPGRRPPRARRLVTAGLVLAVMGSLPFVLPIASSDKPIACSPSVKSADGVLSLGTLLPKTGEFVYSGPVLDTGVRCSWRSSTSTSRRHPWHRCEAR